MICLNIQPNNWYTRCVFHDQKTHHMPKFYNDGVVRDMLGNVIFSLKTPCTKHPPRRPRKKSIESQFQDKRIVDCTCCHTGEHNRTKCKNLLPI